MVTKHPRPRMIIGLNIGATLFNILMFMVGIKCHNILSALPIILTVHLITVYKTCVYVYGNYRVIYVKQVTSRRSKIEVK